METISTKERPFTTGKALFDEIGQKYQDAFGYHAPAHIRSLEQLLSQLPPNSRVVDIGCGTGRPACEMLASKGHKVTGVDLSPVMIESARAQVPNATFHVSDSRAWVPDQSELPFDAVIAYFSFLIGMAQQDIRDFFPKAFKWLKPGGLLVWGSVPVHKEKSATRWLGREIISSSISKDEMLGEIKKAGFVVEEHWQEDYTPQAAGICEDKEVRPEPHLFIRARKPAE